MLQKKRSMNGGGGPINGHAAYPEDFHTLDPQAAEEARLAALRHKLLEARGKRVRPGLDDKVLADWNGLMIAALANAGVMLREPNGSISRRAPSPLSPNT